MSGEVDNYIEDVDFECINNEKKCITENINNNHVPSNTFSKNIFFYTKNISLCTSIIALLISISLWCTKSIRIEPFVINGESFVNFSAGIMAIAATIIVGWQIINHIWINKKITKLKKIQDIVEQHQTSIIQTQEELKTINNSFQESLKIRRSIQVEVDSTKKILKLTEYYNHYNIGLSYLIAKKYMNSFRALHIALYKLIELGDKLDLEATCSVLDKLQLCATSIPEHKIDSYLLHIISNAISKDHIKITESKHYNEIKVKYDTIYKIYTNAITALEH